MPETELRELAAFIKKRAAEMGFAACGIASVEPLTGHGRFLDWIQRGYFASMRWIAREDAAWKRGDVRRIVPSAQSVVCVAMHYRTREEWPEEMTGKVARYARGVDYHDIIVPRLRQLQNEIQARIPCEGRAYADTGPLLERELAQRAGIGWIGKNTMLLSRELGSYFLLGEIMLSLPLPPDAPHVAQYCGSCTRCLDACPTQAFTAPGVLNANRCISFHTIENREHLPHGLREKFGDWVFGCDICQEVCPWNGKSEAFSDEPELWTRQSAAPSLLEMLMAPQDEFSRAWKGSPVKRTKRRGLKRNALNVLRNRKARD